MTNYWIGDSVGRVLGPLTLNSLRELISSGKLKAVTRASRDGASWEPIAQFNEVRDLLNAARPQLVSQQQQAEQLRRQLQQMQEATTHQLLGVKPESPLEEVRGAFFRMARRFSPEQLGADAAPELRKVHTDIFELLARRMREAEAQHPARPAARPAPGGRTMTPTGLRAAQPTAAPTYAAEEFVGLQTRNDKLQVDVRVSTRNAGIFTDHRIINLQSGGIFLPTDRPLKLGTRVDLVLHFDQPERQLKLRSSVIWEYTQNDGKQPRGYGLGLADLRPEERTFVEEFLRSQRPAPVTTAS